jgi:3-hydroxyacyl-[acyl-carrier-protein] dehydratase
MPGVLIGEALAQVAGICLLTMEEHKGKIPFYAGIDKMRFKRQVIPGDTLKLEIEALTLRRNIFVVKGTAYVDNKVAALGEMLFSVG